MKQVLLIGDSIRMGYCEYVKESLADRAQVIYPAENCRSSQYIIMRLSNWSELCDCEKVAVVHFNCGHWDTAHFNYDAEPLTSIGEYKKNICSIVAALKRFFPNAKILFATTTPMNPKNPETCNPRTTEDIMRYNNAIKPVLAELGIEINDLFSVCEHWRCESYVDYAHFTEQNYEILGSCVSQFILPYID